MKFKTPTIMSRWLFWILALLINATGHAVTIVTNLGSAVWTAATVNLYHLWPLSLRMTLFLCGVIVSLSNAWLVKKFDWEKLLGNLVFIIPFSILIQFFTQLIASSDINQLVLIWRVMLDIGGILMVALATSIYQRANLVLHPNDELMQIIRFRYVRGSATIAQLVHYIPPVIIMIMTSLLTHHLWAVNIGTLICLFFQGSFIGYFDRHVFSQLPHYGISKIRNMAMNADIRHRD